MNQTNSRDLEHAQRDARNLVATLELRPEMTLLHLAQAIGLATMVRDALMRTVADRFVTWSPIDQRPLP